MDTKDLEIFKAVYEAGSISKAAKQLYITQSGLSRTVARLESDLGETLFDRTAQGVKPTAYARSLYSKAHKLSVLLEQIAEGVDAEDDRSELIVAAAVGMLLYAGLDIIEDFNTEHPDITLSIEESSDKRIIELLDSSVVELAFLPGPIDLAKYDAALFSRHRHVLVVSKDDPLASKKFVTHSDLGDRKVALLGKDYIPYSNNLRWFAEAGVIPDKLVELTEGESGTYLAAQGEAVCISTDYSSAFRNTDKTTFIPFSNPDCSYDLYLVSKKKRGLSPEAESFRTFALNWIERTRDSLFSWEHSVY